MIHWGYKPHGAAPVQAEGTFMGHYFYFRSRWDRAIIEFAETDQDWLRDRLVKCYTLHTTKDPYGASFLPHATCKRLIWKGCFKFFLYLLVNKFKKHD